MRSSVTAMCLFYPTSTQWLKTELKEMWSECVWHIQNESGLQPDELTSSAWSQKWLHNQECWTGKTRTWMWSILRFKVCLLTCHNSGLEHPIHNTHWNAQWIPTLHLNTITLSARSSISWAFTRKNCKKCTHYLHHIHVSV